MEIDGVVFAKGRDPYIEPWQDVLQLNAFSPALREAAADTVTAIGDQCDGVRCDMAMLMTNEVFARTWGERASPAPEADFWPTLIARSRQAHADLLFMAEVYRDMEWTLQQQGFDLCYDKRLYDRLVHDEPDSVRGHLQADGAYQQRLIRFIENHDEPRPHLPSRPPPLIPPTALYHTNYSTHLPYSSPATLDPIYAASTAAPPTPCGCAIAPMHCTSCSHTPSSRVGWSKPPRAIWVSPSPPRRPATAAHSHPHPPRGRTRPSPHAPRATGRLSAGSRTARRARVRGSARPSGLAALRTRARYPQRWPPAGATVFRPDPVLPLTLSTQTVSTKRGAVQVEPTGAPSGRGQPLTGRRRGPGATAVARSRWTDLGARRPAERGPLHMLG